MHVFCGVLYSKGPRSVIILWLYLPHGSTWAVLKHGNMDFIGLQPTAVASMAHTVNNIRIYIPVISLEILQLQISKNILKSIEICVSEISTVDNSYQSHHQIIIFSYSLNVCHYPSEAAVIPRYRVCFVTVVLLIYSRRYIAIIVISKGLYCHPLEYVTLLAKRRARNTHIIQPFAMNNLHTNNWPKAVNIRKYCIIIFYTNE